LKADGFSNQSRARKEASRKRYIFVNGHLRRQHPPERALVRLSHILGPLG